jgi:broad specificity phosphatase PhoE
MTDWIFLRHGQSRANAEGWLSGWDDVTLTELGEAQARRAGELLRDVPIGRCLSSDLQRASRTAALVLGDRPVPVHTVPELRERHMGCLQGVPWADCKADGRHVRWLQPWEEGPPGGESHAQSVRRALAALRHWDDGTPTLVVAHGSLLRALVGVIDGIPPAELGRLPSAVNCEPIRRRWRP